MLTHVTADQPSITMILLVQKTSIQELSVPACGVCTAVGHLVEGLPFHKFYFDFLSARQNYKAPTNVISQPHVRGIDCRNELCLHAQ